MLFGIQNNSFERKKIKPFLNMKRFKFKINFLLLCQTFLKMSSQCRSPFSVCVSYLSLQSFLDRLTSLGTWLTSFIGRLKMVIFVIIKKIRKFENAKFLFLKCRRIRHYVVCFLIILCTLLRIDSNLFFMWQKHQNISISSILKIIGEATYA
jgi:hypothetical protein